MFKNISIRRKLIFGYAVIAILTCVNASFSYRQVNIIGQPIRVDIPRSIEAIKKNSELDSLAQQIRYYDELLTQSARNYAFTGDKKWEERYNAAVPELDRIIKAAIEQGDGQDKASFSSIDAANLVLVELETQALSLTDQKKNQQAVAILESSAYWEQKAIYSKGLQDYIKRKEEAKDSTIQGSTAILSEAAQRTSRIISQTIFLLVVISVVIFLLALCLGYVFSRNILRSIQGLIRTAREIAGGNFDKRAVVHSKDEIGALATTFNDMAAHLKESRAALEEKTRALEEKTKALDTRVDELERPEELKVGRELKMVELKKEVQELRAEVERYKSLQGPPAG